LKVGGRSWAWTAGASGLLLSLWLLQPGYMSFDSAYQWQQGRLGQYDDGHPPVMAMLWGVVDRAVPGPLGMFALQAVLLWTALAGIGAEIAWPPRWRALLVLTWGLWPPIFGLLAHVWKDVWTMALFALAVWALLAELRRPSAWLRTAALVALLLGCAFRHNAIAGALPLVGWWAARTVRARGLLPGRFRRRLVGLTLAAALLLHLGAGLPARHPAVRRVRAVWSPVAVWDMAAVSLRQGRLLIPPGFATPDLTLDELQGYFREYSATTIFQTGHLRLSLYSDFSAEDERRLLAAWLRLPLDHGRDYAAHRLRLSALLFGWDRAGRPDFQVLSPVRHELPGNPQIRYHPSRAQRYVMGAIMRLTGTLLFAGWVYLMLAFATTVVLVPLLVRGLALPQAGLALAVALSSLAYALPLVLLSGSSEFRYLAWPVLAALLAPALLAADGAELRRNGRTAAEHPLG
jgi:hypothetical protein